ncbi:MAG: hypothetical protein JXQ84_03460 [Rhodospirillaceae bacterium]|nr:hypothetical protein [Rhodospirillaceae bacterium]
MSKDRIRAAAAFKPPKPKRFYETVSVQKVEDGFAVTLDGRFIKTPKRRLLALPTAQLAQAVATEWDAQGDVVDAARMPMTQIANTVIDGVVEAVDAVIDALHGHAEADLLCYRAEYPQSLVVSQAEAWQPVLDWAEKAFGARLRVTSGVVAVEQPPESLAALRHALAGYDPWRLAAVHVLAGAFGSVVLALAVIENHLAVDQAFAVARLDETFQALVWGEDAEAARRAEAIAQEVRAAADFAFLAA